MRHSIYEEHHPEVILCFYLPDLILKPICPEIPSFVKDDIDFLHHLPESTEKGTKLVTFDVTSLYTNIPHDLGENAVRHWLEKCRDKVDSDLFHGPVILPYILKTI